MLATPGSANVRPRMRAAATTIPINARRKLRASPPIELQPARARPLRREAASADPIKTKPLRAKPVRARKGPLRRALGLVAFTIEFLVATAAFCTFLYAYADNRHVALTALAQARAADAMFAAPLVSIDMNGDGRADLANPAGLVREDDLYGSGRFLAPRDGGKRKHEGVDYIAAPGKIIRAPFAGTVSRVGYAYGGEHAYRFIEIADAALGLTARVFYVDSPLAVGQHVQAGQSIGTAERISMRYPLITNHVHVEIMDARGRHLDPGAILPSASAALAQNAGAPAPGG
jgi:murein DD-endopeptidase MepM/ murein hydrolase activator NlpD